MAVLLDLPNEILIQIIDDTIPDDIENFSQCCDRIANLAEETLEQHDDDKRNFDGPIISEHGNEPHYSPLDFLKTIIRNPQLALYPKRLWLGDGDDDYYNTHHDDPDGRDTDIEDEMKDGIRKLLVDCPYIPHQDIERWASKIRGKCYHAGTALLLALLPNLRSISLYDSFYLGDYLREMLDNITEASHDPYPRQGSLALSKLRRVRVKVGNTYDDNREEQVEFLAQLAALLSAKTFRCDRLLCGDTVVDRPHPLIRGEVTEIIFSDSLIYPASLVSILQHVKNLRKFTYHLGGRSNPEWFPLEVCTILEEIANDTLEELDLSWAVDVEHSSTEIRPDHLRNEGGTP
ncbi:hypothetical protein MMC28_009538 [Mycoblastus sanguinarius]|nr:hypothetical protein [Mycoblastus sanguinarius]